tara:strand:- start:9 stop:1178 length:1170 start_codon:yes stop_codon:yes gene_type:complete
MAQDVVSARISAFANLLSSVDKLLEPSEAEKEAQRLTNDIRRMQMTMQIQDNMAKKDEAIANAESDDLLAEGLMNLQEFNKATKPQQRMGLTMLGNLINGPLWKTTAPGETTRHWMNPMRYVKGPHSVNPILMGQIALTAWGGAYVGAFRGGLYLGSRMLGTNTARKLLGPKFFENMATTKMSQAFANSSYVKALEWLNKGGVTKAAAHQKFLTGALKSQAYKTTLKVGVGTEFGRRGFSMVDGNPNTTFLKPGSVYAKNPYSLSGNSYFDPSVVVNVGNDISGTGGMYQTFLKVKFNDEQGLPLDGTARQLARKVQEVAYMYPTSGDPNNPSVGDYISWELYNNLNEKETVYVNDTPIIVSQLRDTFERDKQNVGVMLQWLRKKGYIK